MTICSGGGGGGAARATAHPPKKVLGKSMFLPGHIFVKFNKILRLERTAYNMRGFTLLYFHTNICRKCHAIVNLSCQHRRVKINVNNIGHIFWIYWCTARVYLFMVVCLVKRGVIYCYILSLPRLMKHTSICLKRQA